MPEQAATTPAAPLSPTIPWVTVWVLLLTSSAVAASAAQIALGRADAGFFLLLLTIAMMLVASWFDAATWRIPNALTYTGIVLGLTLNALATGAETLGFDLFTRWAAAPGLAQSLLGFAASLSVGIVILYTGGIGGGDIKLITALAAILGLNLILPVLFYALAGAVMLGLLNLVWQGRVTYLLQKLAWAMLPSRIIHPPPLSLTPDHKSVPLAVPILAGLVLAQLAPPALL